MLRKMTALAWCLIACADQLADTTESIAYNQTFAPDAGVTQVADCFSELSRNHPATLEFRRALRSGDYAARDHALRQLGDAASSYPGEQEFALLSGLGNLWRSAERQSLEESLGALDSAQTTIKELVRAYKVCPTDHRILAWLGPSKIILGRMTLDSELVADGERLLQLGIQRYHMFATFSNLVVYTDQPTSDPGFTRALESARFFLNQAAAECSGEPACTNTYTVPHNIEGTAIYLGDVFARAQDRQSALLAYEVAKRGPDWASWKFQDVIETRIRTLDERIRSAGSWLSLDDMETAPASTSQCSYCHME